MPNLTINGVRIEFDQFGSEQAAPVLLISGLGVQMTRWTAPFCERLATQGFRVIRFDNRDVGLSTHFDNLQPIDMADLVQALQRGELPKLAYTLRDMARDGVGLLDALGVAGAHVVGRSMGGMIAQVIAAEHASRTLSLTSIMSSTGNPRLPPPTPVAMAALTGPGPDPRQDESAYLDHVLATARVLAGPGFQFDEEAQRAQAVAEFNRSYRPAGFGRQFAAMVTAGDRRAQLNTIVAPTLVIHGADDPLITVASGHDTAANIPGARLKVIEGMGHELPAELHESLAVDIAENAWRAAA